MVFLQRAIIIFGCLIILKIGIDSFVLRRDGAWYLILANTIMAGSYSSASAALTRFFIGYPALLSFFIRFFKPAVSVYIIQSICLIGVALCGRRLFRSEWLNRYWLLCVPSFVLFTSLNMSEALFFFICFWSILVFNSNKNCLGSALLGAAMFIRPQQAFFLFVVVFLWFIFKKEFRHLIILFSIMFAATLCLLSFNYFAFGDMFVNFYSYKTAGNFGNSLFGLPFKALFLNFLSQDIPLWKKVYVFGSVAVVCSGLTCLFIRLRYRRDFIGMVLCGWGCFVTMFIFCLGSQWAFHSLPRYILPAFPGAILGFEKILPKSWKFIIPIALVNVLLAIFAETM